eukprot:TRINITY_DN26017_c0_g2_i1.p2 TRINITY_DN26017_c0_g2~~TRINITY_DN26017_c0_g2_i1.p2  ORF type:complete len:442 (+),score=78.15 TRINITY_DN26017_c0_g2_i1:95-1327(+)
MSPRNVEAVEQTTEGRLSLSLSTMLRDATPEGSAKKFQPHHSQSVPKQELLLKDVGNAPITTMMLRNIPNKYTQAKLLQELDDSGFAGTYDFFYLPMDVHNRSNVGYAFVNFPSPIHAEEFRRQFSQHHFQRFHSRKVGTVCVAHVQGLNQNLRHFRNRAVTQAKNDQYRPIVFRGSERVSFETAVAELVTTPTTVDSPLGSPRQPGSLPSSFSEPSGESAAPGVGRQGLEAAIYQLLTTSQSRSDAQQQQQSQGSQWPTPAGYGAAVAPQAAPMPELEEDTSVEMLLALRSHIMTELAHVSGGAAVPPPSCAVRPPPGLSLPTAAPASKPQPMVPKLALAPLVTGRSAATATEGRMRPSLSLFQPEEPAKVVSSLCLEPDVDCPTPRTNGLALGMTYGGLDFGGDFGDF